MESNEFLLLPNEAMAYTVAQEWAEQQGMINKLLMPMVCALNITLVVSPNVLKGFNLTPRVNESNSHAPTHASPFRVWQWHQ